MSSSSGKSGGRDPERMRTSSKVSTSATKSVVPVLSDNRVSYAPVQETATTYSVPLVEPKK
jgi:hypothetical protein